MEVAKLERSVYASGEVSERRKLCGLDIGLVVRHLDEYNFSSVSWLGSAIFGAIVAWHGLTILGIRRRGSKKKLFGTHIGPMAELLSKVPLTSLVDAQF
jgi:hypothetical protein